MAQVAYPKELTKAYWDKKKPTLAKGKKTGIGEGLANLEKKYDAIKWDDFAPQSALANIDKRLKELPGKVRALIDPLAKDAKEVRNLCVEWSGKFKKEKLIPKSASEACDTVADAAKSFIAELEDFEGVQAKELVEARKKMMAAIRKMLKPMLQKTSTKIAGLFNDIKKYAQNPTKENYFAIFSSDCNARGFTTGCKNWDQLLVEFPELRDQCYKGKAMEDFFPGMEDYGAEWSETDFEKRVNSKLKVTGADCYKYHARKMIEETPNIKTFQKAVDKLLTLLDED